MACVWHPVPQDIQVAKVGEAAQCVWDGAVEEAAVQVPGVAQPNAMQNKTKT